MKCRGALICLKTSFNFFALSRHMSRWRHTSATIFFNQGPTTKITSKLWIHRWLVDSPYKLSVMQKAFPCHDGVMTNYPHKWPNDNCRVGGYQNNSSSKLDVCGILQLHPFSGMNSLISHISFPCVLKPTSIKFQTRDHSYQFHYEKCNFCKRFHIVSEWRYCIILFWLICRPQV